MVDFAHERIFKFLRNADIKDAKVRSNGGEVPVDVPECCWFDHSIPHYKNRKMEDMGMKWTSAQIEPEKDGIYSCVVEFYKYPHDIKVVNLEYCGEWKMTETWNLLMWKKRALD